MNSNSPLVTVLMPVYNGSRFLAEAIESILHQTFEDFEFVIIDDASTDSSVEIIKSYFDSRIRLIQNNLNMGQAKTMNKGLRLARAKYIARIDQDDRMKRDRLAKQVEFLEKNPDISLVGSSWEDIDENGVRITYSMSPIEPFQCSFELFVCGENPVAHPSVTFRREIIGLVGGYRAKYTPAEDLDFWLRLGAKDYKFANLGEVLTCYRRTSDQESIKQDTKQVIAHHKALSEFLTIILGNYISVEDAALIRPINFEDTYFKSLLDYKRMIYLKKELLIKFFSNECINVKELLIVEKKMRSHLNKLLKVNTLPTLYIWIGNIVFSFVLIQIYMRMKVKY